ncbi:peptidoglycan DD-metalloendopeptidase family protein [Pricia sp.]|uniref:peptidoglycan DD-metalloendopeptidase family protein n=1 Tax=Pricia sp. TaxID=2268138 RepID=UPI003592FD1A
MDKTSQTSALKSIHLILVLVLMVTACKQARRVADIIIQPTPRELYGRQFENDSTLFVPWENAFNEAMNDSLQIEMPYVEQGIFFEKNTIAYSYNLVLQRGEVFHVEVRMDSLSSPVFVDLYEQTSDSLPKYDLTARNENGQRNLEKVIEKSGVYKVIVQAGIGATDHFQFELYSTPSYAFPVTGKNNEAIQSFWGADREGGRRSHKGVDIFADRGTPVVAVTDGRVSSTGERGLGGKQVWVKSGLLGNSLYYAHLDSILVKTGNRVQIGDTLGLVGNTGNARTTTPHLHFGIYEGYRGAIDPLPFIRINDKPSIDQKTASFESPKITVSATRANLRQSPSVQSEKIGEAKKGDTLFILGIAKKWAHIKTETGQKTYVHQSLIELNPE